MLITRLLIILVVKVEVAIDAFTDFCQEKFMKNIPAKI
jgi:hypothetical protein